MFSGRRGLVIALSAVVDFGAAQGRVRMVEPTVRNGSGFARMLAGFLCAALLLTGVVTLSPSASAAVTSPVTLQIETLTPVGFAAGATVSLRFTATNTTGGTLTFDPGDGLWIETFHSFTEDLPGSMAGGCYPQAWGDLGDYSVDAYFDPLPGTMAAGASISCTYDYTATAQDVANGGLFGTLRYLAADGSTQDTDWFFYTYPAQGSAVSPVVTGTAAVDNTLSVALGYWGMWGDSFTYQWLRDGTPIVGATQPTYLLAAADLGTHVSVQVVGASDLDGTSIPKVSAATGPVAPSAQVVATAFVKAAYQDFLGRAPGASELSAAVTGLGNGTVTKVGFLRGLANSTEWLSVIVTRMYHDTLGRDPDPAGLATWVDWIRTGRFTVAQAAALFYSSEEFYLGLGGNTPSTWVTQLYLKLLGREPEAAGLSAWVAYTTNPAYGRPFVAANFYQSLESRLTRVKNLYQVLLGRDPDPTGWPFWADVIATAGDIELAVSLAVSEEYALRALDRF